MENLGVNPTIKEVINATRKIANRKATSENKVPLGGYKYLSDDNFNHIYDVVFKFWAGNDDPPEFYKAKLCIIEKKGDLHLPKNYNPVCLIILPRLKTTTNHEQHHPQVVRKTP